MKIQFVDLKAQYIAIKSEVDTAIQKVVSNTAFVGGKYVKKFESEFADYCDAKHCIGVGNGTDALTIVLKAIGVSNKDEVIVPANSFIATSEAVTAAGGKVVFVDCHPDYYTIDLNKIEEKITNRTKVIIPVHLYGQPADMDVINALAKKYDLFVIEDAAQAHGAFYKNRKVGTLGDVACFSFYPGKNLGAYGDAGCIVTDNEELSIKCRMLANHGRIEKYNHEIEGFNSRMDGIQGAVLNVKLKYIDQWNDARREVANQYNNLLKNFNELISPRINPLVTSVYHLYVVRARERDKLRKYLKEKDIATGIHYPIGLPYLKAYDYLNHSPEDFPITYKYQSEIISLPIFPEMTQEIVHYVVQQIKQFYS